MGTRDYLFIGMVLGLGGVTSLSHTAHAQPLVVDSEESEGHGLRVGNLEFHPGIGAEVGVETNPFLESDQVASSSQSILTVNEDSKPGATFRVTPHFAVSTIGLERLTEADGEYKPPAFALRGGISGTMMWTGVGPGDPTADGIGQTRFMGDADLEEMFLPERPFSVVLQQEGRITQLPVQGVQSNHYHLGAGGRVEFGSSGGLLRAHLGYKFNFERFDSAQNDGHSHNLTQRVTWEFLPKTALFQELDLLFNNYDDSDQITVLLSDKADSVRTTTRVGVNGAISKELMTTLAIGYGAVFFGDGQGDREAETVVGQAQLTYRPSKRTAGWLTYSRQLNASLQGNTVRINNFHLKGEFMVGKHLTLRPGGRLLFFNYGNDNQQALFSSRINDRAFLSSLDLVTGGVRADVRVTLEFEAEYRLTDWFAFTALGRYDNNISKYAYVFPEPSSLDDVTASDAAIRFVSPVGYTNVVGLLGVRAAL